MKFSRRTFLQAGPLLLAGPFAYACVSSSPEYNVPKTKIKTKYHWARREEWTGRELVISVVPLAERYLMVQRAGGEGWTFPGGVVNPEVYGEKAKDNMDLIRAATEYVHEQTLIAVLAKGGTLLAYGYALDPLRGQMYLAHWINVYTLGQFAPRPTPNQRDILEARWVARDDPYLGSCLKQQLDFMAQAGEGGSLVLERCLR
ncbi:MAG TPA: NUDIX hydrolase [bacterium]|nr:NUDIX hydrolase [Candidatus Omnitrophota bacterium]HOJ58730.1 NUDIX hydrolase [bacterium]HOL95019.1 NUDIX hydrolase [bacterium]HXK93197.1 NUDIX hydrolase [bacterium]